MMLRRDGPPVGVWLAMLWVSPAAGLAVAALAAGLFFKTRDRLQTLALAAFSYPAGVWLIDHPGLVWLLAASALAALLFWLARADK